VHAVILANTRCRICIFSR